ncbi:hypothetical protein J4462_03545 [Candidatus Pacearchaeota archaeon]|nr:hypothetical protein [Candidatus Pacearchaeota archaeon]
MRTQSKLATLVLGALAGVGGCDNSIEREQASRKWQYEQGCRNVAQIVEDKIENIAIYQKFSDGRCGLSYEDFVKATGIDRKLPYLECKDLGLSITVIPEYEEYAELNQEHVGTEGGSGYVSMLIPARKAGEILSKLEQHRRKVLKLEN